MQYELNSSAEYYIVTGKADVAKKNITIAKEYKGLPVREIESEAFINWIKLDSVTIPKSVMRIGERAFSGCKNLQNLQIEEGVEEIGERVTNIGKGCFSGCVNLQRVTFNDKDNWSVVKKNEKIEVTDRKDISFEDLSDPDIAIDLLQKYSEYEWFKS